MIADDFKNGDYEPPTREFIRNSLTYGLDGEARGHTTSLAFQDVGPSASIPLYMLRNKGPLVRALIVYAYKKKSQILRIPILGSLALFIKEKLDERNLTSMNAYLPELDLSSIMGLETDDFIKQLYLQALDRLPDRAGWEGYRHALSQGASKEAIVYLVCTSDEFGARAQVAHLEEYRKAYQKFLSRQRLRRIPVLSHLLSIQEELQILRNQVSSLDARVQNLASTADSLSFSVQATQSKIEEKSSVLLGAIHRNRPVFYSFPDGVTLIQMKEYIFGVPSEEWRLAVFLHTYGFFEPGTEKYFRSILQEGMHVVDVGANLGIYTLHALAAGCQVYAYEPTPRICKILGDNIGINGFEPSGRAKVYNLAVSDRDGEIEFATCENLSGHNSFYASDATDQRIRVKTVRLDQHLGHLEKVDVVKVDVEGAEPLVFKGMQDIIRRNPNIKIIMEFCPVNFRRGKHDPIEFLRTIRSMDLEISMIHEDTGELRKISDSELSAVYSVNLLLTAS